MTRDYLKLKKLPDTPGVYLFLDKNKKILYIGKATSLNDRVKSYFSNDLINTRSPLISKMVESASTIDFRKTSSVLEALLLEADLIKKFKPAYNTKEKDDKSFLCVVITNEDFPKIITKRKKDIDFGDKSIRSVFGPYVNGLQLKEALKIIRKIFPYRDDKCYQCKTARNKNCKPCFNRQINLCPGVCTGEVTKTDYRRSIKYLEILLSGHIDKLSNELRKEMMSQADKKNFEIAGIIKKQLNSLGHIQDVALIKDENLKVSPAGDQFRIESYDIAHLSGKSMVGVMVVVTNGILDKSSYRKFKIKTFDKPNDPGALREIINRRLDHNEWPMPAIIVVDGSTAQLNAVNSLLRDKSICIPVLSVVKDDKHKAKGILGERNLVQKYKKEILLSNLEAHRFAINYHKKVRGKQFMI